MSKYAIALLSLLFIAGTGPGCGHEKKKAATPKEAEKKIDKINFFMETSGSMAGYLQGSTDFRKRIPNLLVNIDGKKDSGTHLYNYYISDSIVPFNGSTQEFINAISVQHPPKGKSSEMHKIFEMIAHHTDSNDISIFVSDCILSYPDAVLRQKGNENINRDNAEGELKATMTKSFLDLKQQKHMCALVYGFNSNFVGSYYTFQNKVIPLKGDVTRPYYMWVIGSRDLLTRFNNQLSDLESMQPRTMAMDFGLFGEPVKSGNVLFKYEKQGQWSIDGDNGLKGVSASAKKPCIFAVAADLSSLPAYAKDTSYLRKHLEKKSASNIDYEIDKIILANKLDAGKLKPGEKLGTGTHIFVFRINNLYQSGEAGIHLPLQYDTSYRALSIMDDSKVSDIAGKTFALQHLIDGVRAAYQNNSQDYIDISIPIKK